MCLLRAKAFEVFIHPGRFAKPQASVLPLFGLACGGKALLKNVQSQVQRFAACQRQRRPMAAVAVELWLAGWCKWSKINDKRIQKNTKDTYLWASFGTKYRHLPSHAEREPLIFLSDSFKSSEATALSTSTPRTALEDSVRIRRRSASQKHRDRGEIWWPAGHPGTSWDHVQHGAVHTRLCKSNLPDPCRVAAQCWMRADEPCNSWFMDCEWAHVMKWIKKGSVGQHGAIRTICPGIRHRTIWAFPYNLETIWRVCPNLAFSNILQPNQCCHVVRGALLPTSNSQTARSSQKT